jgi:hypothetical protein
LARLLEYRARFSSGDDGGRGRGSGVVGYNVQVAVDTDP